MKVIIAGSRGIKDFRLVRNAVLNSQFNITEIVSGGARGVDALGEQYARYNDIPLRVMKADWETFGKGAGLRRNIDMMRYADALIAVWDGSSNGTKHMIETMHEAGKPIYKLICSLGSL